MRGKPGSLYLISITNGPSAPRVFNSFARPRRSHARRNPDSKHSERKAKTSKTVDFPLPFGPSRTVSGVKFFELNLSKCSEILDPEIGDSGRSSRPRYLDGRIGTLSPSPTSRRTAPCIFAFRYREVSPRSDAMKSGVLTRRPRLARPCFRCLACSPSLSSA